MTAADSTKEPFQLRVGYDQDELLGARWWHEGMQLTVAHAGRGGATDASRREALRKLALVAGVVLAGGVGVAYCARGGGTSTRVTTVARDSLELQRERGLFVDAADTSFAYPDAVATTHAGEALDRMQLDRLVDDLRPGDASLQPAYVPTLFQAFRAPHSDAFLRDFQMVRSGPMQRAFGQGQALRELLEQAERANAWAIAIDLPGPESIAFAAALQPLCAAVFVFDNWPHPRGVVPAHLTLAAAVHYRSAFLSPTPTASQPIAFVLDRNRLLPYRDEPDRFDNRYIAKLPTAAFLREAGVQRLLYVVPAGAQPLELDDLNGRFVEYRTSDIHVHMLGLDDLALADSPPDAKNPDATPQPRYYWHGSPGTHWWFWNHYAWASRPSGVTPTAPHTAAFGSNYSPVRRSTLFDGQGIAALGKTREQRTTSSSRSGSWGRSSGGWSGG